MPFTSSPSSSALTRRPYRRFIYFFTYLSRRFPNSLTLLLPISCIPVIIGAAVIHGASWKHPGVPLFGK